MFFSFWQHIFLGNNYVCEENISLVFFERQSSEPFILPHLIPFGVMRNCYSFSYCLALFSCTNVVTVIWSNVNVNYVMVL